MKIFSINTISSVDFPNLNLAIGNFDGVHLGHTKIIKKLVEESKKNNLISSILSFLPHPRKYFANDLENFNIIDEYTKIDLFKKLNVDYYISFKFDKELASLSPEKFIEDILYKKLKIKNLTVGYDFKFGKDRKGNVKLLTELSSRYDFTITVIDPIIDHLTTEVYSSSLVRRNIREGNFEKVSQLLGRHWSMKGKIIRGDGRAGKINFPTANMLPSNHIEPKKGVYAINANYLNNSYNGIANFGIRPTVDGQKLLLEVHLFNFNENIYGKDLTVEFLTFIRDEKKFENFDSLTEQIKKDIQLVKTYHENT